MKRARDHARKTDTFFCKHTHRDTYTHTVSVSFQGEVLRRLARSGVDSAYRRCGDDLYGKRAAEYRGDLLRLARSARGCLKKNLNAPRPSEHPPVWGKKCQNVLLFLTFSALVANPKKTTLHGGQSRSWSAEQGKKKKKKKSGSAPPPSPRALLVRRKNK